MLIIKRKIEKYIVLGLHFTKKEISRFDYEITDTRTILIEYILKL